MMCHSFWCHIIVFIYLFNDIWNKQFSITDTPIVLCDRDGVNIWSYVLFSCRRERDSYQKIVLIHRTICLTVANFYWHLNFSSYFNSQHINTYLIIHLFLQTGLQNQNFFIFNSINQTIVKQAWLINTPVFLCRLRKVNPKAK